MHKNSRKLGITAPKSPKNGIYKKSWAEMRITPKSNRRAARRSCRSIPKRSRISARIAGLVHKAKDILAICIIRLKIHGLADQKLNNLHLHLHWVGSRNSVRGSHRSRLVGMRMLPQPAYPLCHLLNGRYRLIWKRTYE